MLCHLDHYLANARTLTFLTSLTLVALLLTTRGTQLANGQIEGQLASNEAAASSSSALATSTIINLNPQHQEILVQPNSQVRIECKLPQTTPSKSRSYFWNFDRTVGVGSNKQNVLCFESKCVDEPTFGYQLEMDQREIGAYDLIFSNVTYELNDGLYYCKYKDTSPESKQILNREFRLTVLIPPQPPTITPATQTPAREGQEYHLNCQSYGGNPEPNITWFRNDQPIGQLLGLRVEQTRVNETTTSTLSWIPTMDDHQAVYKCLVWNKAMSHMQSFERDYRLQVEYAPRINVGQFNPLKVLVGSTVILPCQVDANPPVKSIRWFKDGHLIGNQYNHTIQEVKLADSSIYSCQADNGIAPLSVGQQQVVGQVVGPASSFLSLFGLSSSNSNGAHSDGQLLSRTGVEAQLQVQVLYPPRVKVLPSKSSPLNEGDYYALNCSVDSWPPVYEFLWTRQDDPTYRRLVPASSSHQINSHQLEFPLISAQDMGNYTCTAFNRMEPSNVNNNNINQHVIERQSSASSLVLVRHKPGVAEISVGNNGETELGSKTQIQCRAKPPGFPEPQYRYWKYPNSNSQNMMNSQSNNKLQLNKQGHGSSVYTIYSAKPDDEAKYGCLAVNELGLSTEADGDLIVNEPPIIIHDTSIRRDEDSRAQGDTQYSITVRASGKPEPKVSWFHRSPVDGRRLELSWAEMRQRFKIETISKPEQSNQVQRPKYSVVSTLTFKNPLEVDDRGLYTVEFSNGLSRQAIEDFQLHVHHAPIPAPKNYPILASQQAGLQQQVRQPAVRVKAGFELGETVNLTCRVSAYPRPDFSWLRDPETGAPAMDGSNSRYKFSLSNPRDDIWESTVTFSQAHESDFGEYLCTVANMDTKLEKMSESLQIVVQLQHKSPPDAPSQLEPVDATQDSITLQWIPGFDGGFALNQYLVQYAPDDQSGLSMSKRFSNADSLGVVMASSFGVVGPQASIVGNNLLLDETSPNSNLNNNYPKLYDCLSMNPCTINHLSPRQAYVFRIRAKNELGFSDFSEELRASTRANISQIPKIMEASLDTTHNVLHFRVEPGSDYLLNNLNARIEYRSLIMSSSASSNMLTTQQLDNTQSTTIPEAIEAQQQEWKPLTSAHIRHEKVEALLNIQPEMEQLRITLCSRSNESLCGPEFVVSIKNAASSFLQEQRNFSLPMIMIIVCLIVVLTVLATAMHSCCLSRRNKKADSIERVEGLIDNKPISTGNGTNNNSVGGNNKSNSQHGSTTSTNSTSATNGTGSNGLQSMDSINNALNGGLLNGANSDHSSDHSRQAKLDTMLPPNYNHYADRASLMMEQQQQQQQQLMQQQGLMSTGVDKLSSPFASLHHQQNGALLSVAQSQQQHSPMAMNGVFSYNQQMDPLSAQQLDHGSMFDANMMLTSGLETDGQQQQQQHQMWSNQSHNQLVDDYNNYNALANYQSTTSQDQMIDPTYMTTGAAGLMSAYDTTNNGTNNSTSAQFYMPTSNGQAYSQPSPHHDQQQQRAQFQQGMANAQQQIYGTLTRKQQQNNSYNSTGVSGTSGSMTTQNNNNNDLIAQNNSTNQQLAMEQQQQQQQQQLLDQQQYSTTNGLIQPPPPPLNQQSQESDYATTGARNGRLIREIIV